MGILNVTPDSFSDGGRFGSVGDAVEEARRMVDRGADIIDVGGESTRPGAAIVPLDEEVRRVVPVVEELRRRTDTVISIDTTKAEVARRAVDAGADIVNDVSGGSFDDAMLPLCAELGVGVVLMHTPGRPDEMDRLGRYDDVVHEVTSFLLRRCAAARAAGVPATHIAVDPGFGFGKDVATNFALLARLGELDTLGYPVLVGVSRKRMIRHIVGDDDDAVEHGTTAAGFAAVANGADIIRVHDVVAGRACADTVAALRRAVS